MRKGCKSVVFAVVLLSAASSQAYALECDGSTTCATGAVSTGAIDITYAKGSNARIWGLADVAMTDQNVANSPNEQDICVFSNKDLHSNSYTVEIASTNAFVLKDASGLGGVDIDYHIKVADGAGGSVESATGAPGGSVTGTLDAGTLTAQPDPTGGCTTNQNAKISVWFDTAPVATSGVYTDSVTLTITPS